MDSATVLDSTVLNKISWTLFKFHGINIYLNGQFSSTPQLLEITSTLPIPQLHD